MDTLKIFQPEICKNFKWSGSERFYWSLKTGKSVVIFKAIIIMGVKVRSMLWHTDTARLTTHNIKTTKTPQKDGERDCQRWFPFVVFCSSFMMFPKDFVNPPTASDAADENDSIETNDERKPLLATPTQSARSRDRRTSVVSRRGIASPAPVPKHNHPWSFK